MRPQQPPSFSSVARPRATPSSESSSLWSAVRNLSRQSKAQPASCWCFRGLTPSIRLGRLDFCPWQSSIFRQSPTFMLKIRKRLDAHEPHELPCYGLTQKLHGRVTNPAYLCTRSTYAQTAATLTRGIRPYAPCQKGHPQSRSTHDGNVYCIIN